MELELDACNVRVLLPPPREDRISFEAWRGTLQDLPDHLPLQQRPDWPLAGDKQEAGLLRLESRITGEVVYVGFRRHRLRALPGAWYLQVSKLGVGLPEWAIPATLTAITEIASRWWRVARVRVELCLLDQPERLAGFERAGQSLGYSVVAPIEYEHTLVTPIPDNGDMALAQFHRSVFKNTRKLERAGHVIRAITHEHYGSRLKTLYEETMSRTGARIQTPDMDAIIRTSAAQPDRFCLLGLFRLGTENPESLMAFRWCGRAGPYAYDLLAASTRLTDETGQIPMMPAIMLAMFDWARVVGARQFDFGGVVLDGDPRAQIVAGITRFKKQFGGQVVRVGSDLHLEPRIGWRVLSDAQQSIRRFVGR